MSDHQIGDGPIEPGYRRMMNDVAGVLDRFFNGEKQGDDRKTGFVLLVFNFGDGSPGERCNYISNTQRSDIVNLLQEQLKRFKGQEQ